MYSRLQYISQGNTPEEHLSNIRLALVGGCGWIQLRAKDMPLTALSELADRAKRLCDSYKAVFIVNDNINIAQESGASGVHLGLQDKPVSEARLVLGRGKLIGGSANTLEDCLQRAAEGCDYIGLGPFRHTVTKEKLSPILGIEGFRKIMRQLKQNNITVPVYAIGGIRKNDTEELMDTGIYGVAISGEITRAADKKEVIEGINMKLTMVSPEGAMSANDGCSPSGRSNPTALSPEGAMSANDGCSPSGRSNPTALSPEGAMSANDGCSPSGRSNPTALSPERAMSANDGCSPSLKRTQSTTSPEGAMS